jgi:anti-anti-sigma factor
MTRDGARHTLALLGDLNRASAPALEAEIERLCTKGVDVITLDLSELAFVDWTGAMVIAFRSSWCKERGIDFTLIPGSGVVQRVFELTGLVHRLEFEHGDAVRTDRSDQSQILPVGPLGAVSQARLSSELK